MLEKIQDFITITLSIVIEATPFLVLGTLVATLALELSWFDKLAKRLPKRGWKRRLSIASMGVAMPVCECGNIPVSRTLAKKGFNKKEVMTFLLAAPILNPITIVTTREAFRNVPWIMPARVLGGLFVALIVSEVLGRLKGEFWQKDFKKICEKHSHEEKKESKKKFKISRFCIRFAEEFWGLIKLLIIGAAIAGFLQVAINQNSFESIGQGIITGAIFMLILGFIISICSSVDAFFALSYSGFVKNGALLTFLIAGPMVDIKSVSMLRATLTKKIIIWMCTFVALLSLGIGIGLSLILG
jgi:uncharacterized protein